MWASPRSCARSVPTFCTRSSLTCASRPIDRARSRQRIRRVADFSNADRVVWGQYAKFGDQIRIDATLQDIKNDRTRSAEDRCPQRKRDSRRHRSPGRVHPPETCASRRCAQGIEGQFLPAGFTIGGRVARLQPGNRVAARRQEPGSAEAVRGCDQGGPVIRPGFFPAGDRLTAVWDTTTKRSSQPKRP